MPDLQRTTPAVTEASDTEPATTEPAVTEASDTEPATTEPAEVGPAATHPAKAKPATQPSKTAPSKTAPSKTAPPKTAPAKTAPSKTAPPKTTPSKTVPSRAEPANTEPVNTGPASTRRLPPWLLPLLLATATVLYVLLRPAPPSAPTGTASFPPATAAAVALLGDLDTGSTVAGFRVDGIEGPGAEGQDAAAILVHLSHNELRLAITIAPRGALDHNPPAQTAEHDLFFGHLQPDDADLKAEEVGALLDAFKARVSAHE